MNAEKSDWKLYDFALEWKRELAPEEVEISILAQPGQPGWIIIKRSDGSVRLESLYG